MPKVSKQSNRRRRPKSSANGKLLDRVQPIDFADEGLKVAVYGRSGTGKTTFWSTFPKPLLAVIASGGKRSGELRSVQNVKGISKFELGDTSEIPDLCKEVAQDGNYQTVVLDHATYLQDLRMKEVLGLEDIPAQKSWGMATQQDYGQCSLTMKEYLRCFFDLSCNVVIVAQEREFNTDNDSEILMPDVGAALSPSVTGWLNPAADYIAQTFIREGTVERKVKIGGKSRIRKEAGGIEYCLRTGPHAVFTTKFRVPKGKQLPDVVVDPDYDKLLEIIHGTPSKV